MKKLIYILTSIFLLSITLTFMNCDGDDEPTELEKKTAMLVDKTGGWSTGGGTAVQVPAQTATDPEDWAGFKAVFTATNITTSGHPAGAEAVWPSGTYTTNDDVTTITRHDGVVMTVTSLTETKLTVSFQVPDGTETTGKVAALEGSYTFNLQ